ncbi:MAG: hypothetical protein HYT93_03590 [Parcubacteria group bacterium]|nr:hypothetical protein [Parcubacteria group bacterium]
MVKNEKFFKIVFQGIVLAAVIVAAFYLAHFAKGSDAVQEAVLMYGYWGVAVVALISGFNLAIPVPAVAFMPLFLESGLNFWFSIFFLVAGVTVADFIAYYIGKLGRHITLYSKDGKMLARLEHIRERYRWGPLVALFFFISFIPFPNEILLIPLGFLGYTFYRLLPIVIVGNFLFNLLYSTGAIQLFGAL